MAKKYAEEIKNEGSSKVILDLRGNGGGYVQAAKTVASLWLEKNALIVSEKTGSKTVEEIRATGDNPLKGIKTVILLDGSSASASEIVAGALKEHKAAQIVGEKSYGKGSVQTTIDMPNGALLKVTIAKWFTPSGKNISNNGISPDIKVSAPKGESYLLNDIQKGKMEARKKILLVEDDEVLASVYRARLEMEDFEVMEVHDGEQALTAALRYRPDLMILDAMMPKISGFDVLDILRNTPETMNLQIIMLTALSQESDRERAEKLGVDEYLVKSQVMISDVIEKVREHLGIGEDY